MIETATISEKNIAIKKNDGLSFKPSKVKPYILSAEQQNLLDSQLNLDKNLYTDAKIVYNNLKNKYAL